MGVSEKRANAAPGVRVGRVVVVRVAVVVRIAEPGRRTDRSGLYPKILFQVLETLIIGFSPAFQ